jgi:hypothetical protein
VSRIFVYVVSSANIYLSEVGTAIVMKSSLSHHFGGILPTSSGLRTKQGVLLLHVGFLLGLFFDPEYGGACLPEMSVDLQHTTQDCIIEGETRCQLSPGHEW